MNDEFDYEKNVIQVSLREAFNKVIDSFHRVSTFDNPVTYGVRGPIRDLSKVCEWAAETGVRCNIDGSTHQYQYTILFYTEQDRVAFLLACA